MDRILKIAPAVAALLLAAGAAQAAGPEKRIPIYVEPYYVSSQQEGVPPRVAVGKQFDKLLASSERTDILAARDLIVQRPDTVTPMRPCA